MYRFRVGDKVKLRYVSLEDIWGVELFSKVGEIEHTSETLEDIMFYKYDICFDNGDYYTVNSDEQLQLVKD